MTAKFTLRREYLNSGGYNTQGHYYGVGAPLYWWCDDKDNLTGHVRAISREAAKAEVRDLFPGINVTFYR